MIIPNLGQQRESNSCIARPGSDARPKQKCRLSKAARTAFYCRTWTCQLRAPVSDGFSQSQKKPIFVALSTEHVDVPVSDSCTRVTPYCSVEDVRYDISRGGSALSFGLVTRPRPDFLNGDSGEREGILLADQTIESQRTVSSAARPC